MAESQSGDEPQIAEVTASAYRLIGEVDEFAGEFGAMILRGQALPPRAAEQLAVLLRLSESLRTVLARGKSTEAAS